VEREVMKLAYWTGGGVSLLVYRLSCL